MSILSSNDKLRIVAGIVQTDSAGAVSSTDIPNVLSVTTPATGQYKLTLDKAYGHLMGVIATPSNSVLSAVLVGADVGNASTPYFTVGLKDSNAAPNYIVSGGAVSDPTTPSSQITGAGNTTWNVDTAAALACAAGNYATVAASADEVIHSGSQLVANGESCKAAVVVYDSSGTPTLGSVTGTAATTGTETAPLDADITTGVSTSDWARLAVCTINRTGDTTVTQSQDNTEREPGSGAGAALCESLTLYIVAFLLEK